MATVTVNLPNISNWRTTLLGIASAVGGALYQQFVAGGLTWPVAAALIVWTVFCYLVPDAAKSTDTEKQLAALFAAVLPGAPLIPTVQARTDAPATDTTGAPLPPA